MNYKILIIVIIIIVTIVVSIKGSKTLGSFKEGMFDKPYYKMENCALNAWHISGEHTNIDAASKKCDDLPDCIGFEFNKNNKWVSYKHAKHSGGGTIESSTGDKDMYVKKEHNSTAMSKSICTNIGVLQENKEDLSKKANGISVASDNWMKAENCDANRWDIDKNGNDAHVPWG